MAMKRDHFDESKVDRIIQKTAAIRSHYYQDREKISELLDIIYSGINLNEPHSTTKMLPFLFFMIEYICKDEFAPLIQEAVNQGADPNLKCNYVRKEREYQFNRDEYLLQTAIRNVMPRTVHALLLSGADPTIADRTNQNFLAAALNLQLPSSWEMNYIQTRKWIKMDCDQTDIVRSLLYYGASPLMYFDGDETHDALFLYSHYTNYPKFQLNICKLLVRFGSNIDELPYDKQLALYHFGKANNLKIIPILRTEKKNSLWRLIQKIAYTNIPSKVFPKEMVDKIMEYVLPEIEKKESDVNEILLPYGCKF